MSKKSIRENFRDAVFKRDNYKCVFCDITVNLDAHHITDRHLIFNGGYVKENGITLCANHHDLVEDWNRYGEVTDEMYHPNNLYKIINSRRKDAFLASVKLGVINYAKIKNSDSIIFNKNLPICSKNIEGVYLLLNDDTVEYFLHDEIEYC